MLEKGPNLGILRFGPWMAEAAARKNDTAELRTGSLPQAPQSENYGSGATDF